MLNIKDRLRAKGYVPAKEVASRLGLTLPTIYNWLKAGSVHGERLGAAHWVEWRSVVAYLKQTSPEAARMLGSPA